MEFFSSPPAAPLPSPPVPVPIPPTFTLPSPFLVNGIIHDFFQLVYPLELTELISNYYSLYQNKVIVKVDRVLVGKRFIQQRFSWPCVELCESEGVGKNEKEEEEEEKDTCMLVTWGENDVVIYKITIPKRGKKKNVSNTHNNNNNRRENKVEEGGGGGRGGEEEEEEDANYNSGGAAAKLVMRQHFPNKIVTEVLCYKNWCFIQFSERGGRDSIEIGKIDESTKTWVRLHSLQSNINSSSSPNDMFLYPSSSRLPVPPPPLPTNNKSSPPPPLPLLFPSSSPTASKIKIVAAAEDQEEEEEEQGVFLGLKNSHLWLFDFLQCDDEDGSTTSLLQKSNQCEHIASPMHLFREWYWFEFGKTITNLETSEVVQLPPDLSPLARMSGGGMGEEKKEENGKGEEQRQCFVAACYNVNTTQVCVWNGLTNEIIDDEDGGCHIIGKKVIVATGMYVVVTNLDTSGLLDVWWSRGNSYCWIQLPSIPFPKDFHFWSCCDTSSGTSISDHFGVLTLMMIENVKALPVGRHFPTQRVYLYDLASGGRLPIPCGIPIPLLPPPPNVDTNSDFFPPATRPIQLHAQKKKKKQQNSLIFANEQHIFLCG